MNTFPLSLLVAALAVASQAAAQDVHTAPPAPTVNPEATQEAVKGARSLFGVLERAQQATQKMNGAMLQRREQCVALARAGRLGDGPKGNGAMAQYKCIVGGAPKAAAAK